MFPVHRHRPGTELQLWPSHFRPGLLQVCHCPGTPGWWALRPGANSHALFVTASVKHYNEVTCSSVSPITSKKKFGFWKKWHSPEADERLLLHRHYEWMKPSLFFWHQTPPIQPHQPSSVPLQQRFPSGATVSAGSIVPGLTFGPCLYLKGKADSSRVLIVSAIPILKYLNSSEVCNAKTEKGIQPRIKWITHKKIAAMEKTSPELLQTDKLWACQRARKMAHS